VTRDVNRVLVSRCAKCPAFSVGRCQVVGRAIMTDLRKAPPEWCPLRKHVVTLQLQE
jgi:hypothetical protein